MFNEVETFKDKGILDCKVITPKVKKATKKFEIEFDEEIGDADYVR